MKKMTDDSTTVYLGLLCYKDIKMTLDFSDAIKKLKEIESKFNKTDDPAEKYALIKSLNHIGEQEILIHRYWEDLYRKAMLMDQGKSINEVLNL